MAQRFQREITLVLTELESSELAPRVIDSEDERDIHLKAARLFGWRGLIVSYSRSCSIHRSTSSQARDSMCSGNNVGEDYGALPITEILSKESSQSNYQPGDSCSKRR
ncbi:hypothetical protein SELMODRAFT_430904 [Selaginella moellendorffii]|uniref:Uncharacterized protein n=1 Tax=Selaginella moellendorffii TaxID=88036 RepID=D8TAW8_SELML|nr:hypothetical protein SELMODRAFT_430904 [Selaginella moellendorffii]